jgi:3-(3-hydroxy-phenyl)propionate hydroxylase
LTPPFIGQGMGAGLRDAMNLAWKLAAVLNNDLPASALETYEIERKPHAQAMIRLALAMGWAMTSGGRLGMVIRRAVAPRLRFIPGLRRRVEDSTTPALRRSSLITKSRRPRELAGSLCPNPVLDGGIRLDAILGGGFALISARPLDPERSEQFLRRGAKVITANPGTELARWLRSGRATAAIIRPDRTVMQTSRRLPPLCSAVPRFMSPELTRRIST